MWKQKVFIIVFSFLFIFAIKTEASNFYRAENIRDRMNERFEESLQRLCAVRIRIHKKFPRFPIPRICRTQDANPPTLEFYAEPESITEGEGTTLFWSSDNTLFCEASGGWGEEKTTSGEEVVYPTETTEYILTCDGVGEGIEKSLTIEVNPALPQNLDHIVISEVYYRGAAANEWVEIYNNTGAEVSLNGWIISDGNSSDPLPDASVPNESFAVIVGSTVDVDSLSLPEGALVITLANSTIGSGLNDTGDTITLNNGTADVDSVTYGSGEGVVPGVPVGHSIYRLDLSIDTDSASDWGDLEIPTPGGF